MSRDELLYTGATSASYATRKEAANKAKLEKKAVLTPVAELVISEIQKERSVIANEIGNIIHVDMSETDVKATVLGLRLADQRLSLLQTRLQNILKSKPLPKRKEADNE